MCFVGDDLYALSFSPNRTDKQPDRDGKLYKISGLIGAKSRPKSGQNSWQTLSMSQLP